jgi:hypothetical protein
MSPELAEFSGVGPRPRRGRELRSQLPAQALARPGWQRPSPRGHGPRRRQRGRPGWQRGRHPALTGISLPESGKKSGLDVSAFVAVIEKVVARDPDVKLVATTLREVANGGYRRGVRSLHSRRATNPNAFLRPGIARELRREPRVGGHHERSPLRRGRRRESARNPSVYSSPFGQAGT